MRAVRLRCRGKNKSDVFIVGVRLEKKKSQGTNYYTWYKSNFERICFIHMQEKTASKGIKI